MSDTERGRLARWSELPMSALTLAFGKLELEDRAGRPDCCALVCQRWAEAAAAATVRIKLKICTDTDSLQAWLRNRGSNLRLLYIASALGIITAVPCARLESLGLCKCGVNLSAGSLLLRDLPAATALKALAFDNVTFHKDPELPALLDALPGLQHLELLSVKVAEGGPQQLVSTGTAPADSLTASKRLWSTQRDPYNGTMCFTDEGIQTICKLTNLQVLLLQPMQDATAAGLAALQELQSLKCLGLAGLTFDITTSSTAAWLSKLPALTALELGTSGRLEPAILNSMTRLKQLNISDAWLPDGEAEGVAGLVAQIQQMQQLTMLSVCQLNSLRQCPPAAHAALTSSSNLQHLCWSLNPLDDTYRTDIWQHMFKTTQQQLTSLYLLRAHPWSTQQLALLQSCSWLQDLWLRCGPDLLVTPLLQLTCLSSLHAAYATGTTISSIAELSALHSLRDLRICEGGDVSLRHLQELTVLTQLTSLGLREWVSKGQMQEQLTALLQVDEQFGFCGRLMRKKARRGSPPDVWSQLLACCEQSKQQAAAAGGLCS